MPKKGRPRGPSFRSQTALLSILLDFDQGLNLKTLIEKTGFDRKTVINTMKDLCQKGVIEKTRIGRVSIHKIIRPEGPKYYQNLRLERTLKETKPIKFDRLLGERPKKYRVTGREVLERLLQEPHHTAIMKRENPDLILRRVISELIEKKKDERRIDV